MTRRYRLSAAGLKRRQEAAMRLHERPDVRANHRAAMAAAWADQKKAARMCHADPVAKAKMVVACKESHRAARARRQAEALASVPAWVPCDLREAYARRVTRPRTGGLDDTNAAHWAREQMRKYREAAE